MGTGTDKVETETVPLSRSPFIGSYPPLRQPEGTVSLIKGNLVCTEPVF